MAINPNRFNDPALGQAFGNLASIFAPPSAQDLVGYSTAAAKKQEAERLAWLFDNPTDPLADRKATMAGVYLPTQSYYAQDQNNATTRYNIDTDARTTLSTNAADNARALATNAADNQRATITGLFGPLSEGQVRPEVPAAIAGTQGLPAIAPAFGTPKPLSVDQLNAQTLQGMPQKAREAVAFGSTPLEEILQGGQTVFSTRPEAIGQVAPPPAAGSQAKPENGMAQLADGRQIPAIQDVTTGRWKHAQTGEELPPDIRVFKTPAPVGTAEQVGVGKPVANNIDRQLIDVAVAKDTAVKLRGMIAASPASQGAVGWLRGTAQNVVQTGGELGQYFGGQIQQVTDAIASGAADASLAGAFDPNIPAIEMMANLLAFQYAKTTTGERLSNEMLRAAKAALGLEGLTANQASSLARIDMAIKQMESQEQILRDIRTNGVGAGQPSTPAAPPTPMDAAGAPPEGIDPADWEFMTPEERALFQ